MCACALDLETIWTLRRTTSKHLDDSHWKQKLNYFSTLLWPLNCFHQIYLILPFSWNFVLWKTDGRKIPPISPPHQKQTSEKPHNQTTKKILKSVLYTFLFIVLLFGVIFGLFWISSEMQVEWRQRLTNVLSHTQAGVWILSYNLNYSSVFFFLFFFLF